MGRKTPQDKRLLVAGNMPPLYHTIPGEKFDIRKSEVLEWISKRPGLLLYLFDKLTQSGQIEYDSKNKKWKGVYYDGD